MSFYIKPLILDVASVAEVGAYIAPINGVPREAIDIAGGRGAFFAHSELLALRFLVLYLDNNLYR